MWVIRSTNNPHHNHQAVLDYSRPSHRKRLMKRDGVKGEIKALRIANVMVETNVQRQKEACDVRIDFC